MRPLLALATLVVAAVLALVQLASSAAYGDLATRPSLPAALHALDPGLLRPFLGGTLAQAQAALHLGDLGRAATFVQALPAGGDRDDLQARIAAARGDRDGALAAYVRAGDVVRAQALIDALASGDARRAVAAERALLARLDDDPNAAEVTGQAWWRLGQLQALVGYQRPAEKSASWRDAEASYERALAYAPNEETYLLAAGYQSLANGDAAAAQRWYARAAQVVPDSADAYAGLAWTAAARHDCVGALANARRARVLRPAPRRDVADDPLFGPALHSCGLAAP
jgi:tetratricopeptide (TPR) repeat protein